MLPPALEQHEGQPRPAKHAKIHEHFEELDGKRKATNQHPTVQQTLQFAESPQKRAAGESRSLMHPSPLVELVHPFGAELKNWSAGIQVDCGKDWTREAILEALERGPHPSAMTEDSYALFNDDIAYQVEAGFSRVVLASDLMTNPPKNLKISPVAVVPQTNRRGRIILDLSFPVRKKEAKRRKMGPVLAPSVNETTVATAPSLPVRLIGKILSELMEFMATAPDDADVLFSKIDLSDGFWRMIVQPDDVYNFCYVLPQPPGKPMRIVIPSALQMGWQESPGYFCAATETGRDVAQWILEQPMPLPKHPLESYLMPDYRPSMHSTALATPWKISVFVDDYIVAVLSNTGIKFIKRLARSVLYGIHSIFPPPEVTGHTGGKNPVSIKKLERGDGKFSPTKELLGFTADGKARTWVLPEGKQQAIAKEIKQCLKQVVLPKKQLERS
jgi:hypothetical protein